jgi:elongation factor G
MSLQITIPENYLGDIMGDMNKRRGRIYGMDMVDGCQVVNAEAPMSELSKYATDLRSMTQGKGRFAFSFLRYDEVPFSETDRIIKERAKEKEEAAASK